MHKFNKINREKTEGEDFMERFHDLSFRLKTDINENIVSVETDDPTIIAWLAENGLVEE